MQHGMHRDRYCRRGYTLAILLYFLVSIGLFSFVSGCRSGEPVQEDEKSFAVEVITAAETLFSGSLELSGEIKALRQVAIIPAVPGRVTEIKVREGDQVEKGQLLLSLENTSQYLQVRQARVSADNLREEVEKVKKLVAAGAVPAQNLRSLQSQLQQAEIALELALYAYEQTLLKAPLAGKVGSIMTREGELVGTSPVMTVSATEKVLVQFTVDEAQLYQVQEGQAVAVAVPAVDRSDLAGTVVTVAQSAIAGSRSYLVEVEVDNPEEVLRPGMFAYISLEGEAVPRVSVPASALVEKGDRVYLFVVEGTRARQRQVETGKRSGGMVEIVSGLKPGERYIRRIPSGLKDGSLIEISGEE